MEVHVSMTWKDLGGAPAWGARACGADAGPDQSGRPTGPDQMSITKLRGAASQQRHLVAMSCNCAVASGSVFPDHVWVGALYTELAPGFPGSSSGKARPHEAGKD